MWLNIWGWSALIGTGVVLGVALALISPLQPRVAIPVGVGAAWVALLILDRRRYLNSPVSLGDNRLDAETGHLIVQALERLGIAASYKEFTDEDEEGTYVYRAISCRQREADQVRRMMTKFLGLE